MKGSLFYVHLCLVNFPDKHCICVHKYKTRHTSFEICRVSENCPLENSSKGHALLPALEMGFPPVAALADKQSTGLFGASHKLHRNFLPSSNPFLYYKQNERYPKGHARFARAGDGISARGGLSRQTVHRTVWCFAQIAPQFSP